MNENTPAEPADTPLGERLAGGLLAGHDAAQAFNAGLPPYSPRLN
ncbi:hypothetical protein [Phenylobacterium hankyongense]|nr:hypothetical protein [Phenylobacterium hankyongense]